MSIFGENMTKGFLLKKLDFPARKKCSTFCPSIFGPSAIVSQKSVLNSSLEKMLLRVVAQSRNIQQYQAGDRAIDFC